MKLLILAILVFSEGCAQTYGNGQSALGDFNRNIAVAMRNSGNNLSQNTCDTSCRELHNINNTLQQWKLQNSFNRY